MKKIILASTSPRRQGLLQQIGLKFQVVPSKYREEHSLISQLSPEKLAMHLAYGKAKDVANRVSSGVVIGADTFLFLNGKMIGKPNDSADAAKILRMISGKVIKVYSGIALIDKYSGKEVGDYEVTKIKLRRISDSEIKNYISTGEPLDKAGAIGIQGLGAIFISEIDGCYSNVMGLPLFCLAENLKKIGVNIFDYH
jgi:septum formation protein